MEGKHVIQSLKSYMVLTLIFSYHDYYDCQKVTIRSLCVNGAKFVEQNKQQMRYFSCLRKMEKVLFQNSNLLYLSKKVGKIQYMRFQNYHQFQFQQNNIKALREIEVVKIFFKEPEKSVFLLPPANNLQNISWFLEKCKEIKTYGGFLDTLYSYYSNFSWDKINVILLNNKEFESCPTRFIEQCKPRKLSFLNLTKSSLLMKTLLFLDQSLSQLKCLKIVFLFNDDNMKKFEAKFLQSIFCFSESLEKLSLRFRHESQDQSPKKIYKESQINLIYCSQFILKNLRDLELQIPYFSCSCLNYWPFLKRFKLKYFALGNDELVDFNIESLMECELECETSNDKKDSQTKFYEEQLLLHLKHVEKLFIIGLYSIEALFKNSICQKSIRWLKISKLGIYFMDLFFQISKFSALYRLLLDLEVTTQFLNQNFTRSSRKSDINRSIKQIKVSVAYQEEQKSDLSVPFTQELGSFINSLQSIEKIQLSQTNNLGFQTEVLASEIQKLNSLKTVRLWKQTQQLIPHFVTMNYMTIQKLELAMEFQDHELQILSNWIKRCIKLKQLILKACILRKANVGLSKLLESIKHSEIRKLEIGLDYRGSNSLEILTQIVGTIVPLLIDNCKKLLELWIPIKKLSESSDDIPDLLKLKQDIIDRLTAELPLIELIKL